MAFGLLPDIARAVRSDFFGSFSRILGSEPGIFVTGATGGSSEKVSTLTAGPSGCFRACIGLAFNRLGEPSPACLATRR